MSSLHHLPFTTLDVFTSTPYSGNPLAIVFLPSPSVFQPTQAQLQLIAKEFNLSETVFVEAASSEDDSVGTRRLRIFVTEREILFAGHPTIGTASWCLVHEPNSSAHPPVKSLTLKAGRVPISLAPSLGTGYVTAQIPHNLRIHAARVPLAQLLELHHTVAPFLLAAEHHLGFPVVSIVHGMTCILVELPSLEALAVARVAGGGAVIQGTSAAQGGYLDEGWESGAQLQVYFFVRRVSDEAVGTRQEVIRTRMMVRGIEDPATGSAASSLASYLAIKEFKEDGERREWMVVQGVEMERRSDMPVRVTLTKDGEGVETIELSGSAVMVSEGTIRV